jgi:uncharacterized membrane protein (DUF441 family)
MDAWPQRHWILIVALIVGILLAWLSKNEGRLFRRDPPGSLGVPLLAPRDDHA